MKPETDKPRRGGAWIVAALVVGLVMVGYPLSWGPACILVGQGILHPKTAAIAYYPMLLTSDYGPDWLRQALLQYAYAFDDGATGLRWIFHSVE